MTSIKFFSVLSIVVLTFGLNAAFADEPEKLPKFSEQTGLFTVLHTDVAFDLFSKSLEGIKPDTTIDFAGGLAAHYFFTPNVALSLETDFVDRGLKYSGTSIDNNVWFADIGFGPTFAYQGFLPDSARNFFTIGGYAAIPTSSDFWTSSSFDGGAASIKSQVFYGLLIRSETLFELNRALSLGFDVFFKIPFTEGAKASVAGVDAGKGKFLDIGLGLVLGFKP